MPASIPVIGVIGQGFIGKHLADDIAERGYQVVRYALEAPYNQNRASIAGCGIVFVAVPTPTTPNGFDISAVEAVMPLIGAGKIVVIKSTVLPDVPAALQGQYPQLTILHVPEFLREKSAAADTKEPPRTIIGMAVDDAAHRAAAALVLSVLPASPYTLVCDAKTATLIKYGGNCFLALKVVYMNIMYEAATTLGVPYADVAAAMAADPRIGSSHMQVLDSSGHAGSDVGRGAGGHCFPKDLAAFSAWYAQHVPTDREGQAALQATETKNCSLLRESHKDTDILQAIYGE